MTVDEIAGMKNPGLRNLQITQRYHELALGLRDVGMADDATWCAFAVWASKTAGASIRGDELPSVIRNLLEHDQATADSLHQFNSGLEKWLVTRLEHSHLLEVSRTVNSQVSAAIAEGNVHVFRELAPLFTVLVEDAPQSGGKGSATRLAAAIAKLQKEGVDTRRIEPAFEHYQNALTTPGDRPTLILAGNIQAVAHEQERLQPYITQALDAAIKDTFVEMVDRVIIDHVPTAGARHILDTAVAEVGAVIERVWQTGLTIMMMRLDTATEKLDLHHDVPGLPDGLFPSTLTNLDGSPAAGPYGEWDTTEGKGTPTGAEDWAELKERMNYIVTLFRSRQRQAALFNPPFTDAQLDVLAQGTLPPGPL
jgi:hypothetical protein